MLNVINDQIIEKLIHANCYARHKNKYICVIEMLNGTKKYVLNIPENIEFCKYYEQNIKPNMNNI